MQVPDNKEVANHVVPESCVQCREVLGEALTGVRIGQPSSRDSFILGADAVPLAEGNTDRRVFSRVPVRPGVVVEPGMCARSLHGNREISGLTSRRHGLARIGKARSRSR